MKTYVSIFSSIMLTLLMSGYAYAASGTDVGIYFGVKNADFNPDNSSLTFKSATGIMAGVVATGDMGGVMMRTGGYYSRRKAAITSSGSSADLTISSIDVPVAVQYNFSDMLGMFGGGVFAFKIKDDCTGDSTICATSAASDVKSYYLAAQLGLRAKLHPNWAGELFYEKGLSDISQGTSVDALSIGVTIIY